MIIPLTYRRLVIGVFILLAVSHIAVRTQCWKIQEAQYAALNPPIIDNRATNARHDRPAMWRLDAFSLWGILSAVSLLHSTIYFNVWYTMPKTGKCCLYGSLFSIILLRLGSNMSRTDSWQVDLDFWRYFRSQIFMECHAMVALNELTRRNWAKIFLSQQVICCISSINSLNSMTSKRHKI